MFLKEKMLTNGVFIWLKIQCETEILLEYYYNLNEMF